MLHKASKQAFVLFTIMINWPFSPCPRWDQKKGTKKAVRVSGIKEKSFWLALLLFIMGLAKCLVSLEARSHLNIFLCLVYEVDFRMWFLLSVVTFDMGFLCSRFFLAVEKQKQDFLCVIRCEFTPDSNLNNRMKKHYRRGMENVMRLRAITHIHLTPTRSW